MIKIKVQDSSYYPVKGSELASGYDVKAASIKEVYSANEGKIPDDRLEKMQKIFEEKGRISLRPFETIKFGTGIFIMDMPIDVEIQVRPRSGFSTKTHLAVANSPGTVDPDYRGEIIVSLKNKSPFYSIVSKNERIAQIVPAKLHKEDFEFTLELKQTERGDSGFGDSGKF